MHRIYPRIVLSALFLFSGLCFAGGDLATAQENSTSYEEPSYEKQSYEENTEHTLKLADGAASAPAKITDVAWIAGHWRGEALGGTVEEVWAPPIGNSMMGMFRLVQADGSAAFLEILTLSEEEGTLILRLKHFNSDLTGWEEKDESVDFRFVKAEGQTAWFEGMTFRRVDEETLSIVVANEKQDGTIGELAFTFKAF